MRTKGVQFSLNGYPYYANGFNAYWLMYVASDPSQRSKISTAFQDASRHGLTVARTWAFSDGGYRALQYSPGSYNEDMFQVTSIKPNLSVCVMLCFDSVGRTLEKWFNQKLNIHLSMHQLDQTNNLGISLFMELISVNLFGQI